MKLLGIALIILSLNAMAKSDQEMVAALESNPTLMRMGIEKSDIRRGMKIASSVIADELNKECSVYLEGFAVLSVDDDCDGNGTSRIARRDLKQLFPLRGKTAANILLTLDTDMDGDGYGDLVSRFVENAVYNFVPRAAEAQDYNSSRNNKSYASRGEIIMGSMDVISVHEKELVEIVKGNTSSEQLIRSISEKMASLESDPKFAAMIFKEFLASLQVIYMNDMNAKKTASLEQSERLYTQISRRSGLSEEMLKEIMKNATVITLKEIVDGGSVDFPEFGLIAVDMGDVIVDQASRTGRNPQTGKEIKVAAKKITKFKAGKALADTVK